MTQLHNKNYTAAYYGYIASLGLAYLVQVIALLPGIEESQCVLCPHTPRITAIVLSRQPPPLLSLTIGLTHSKPLHAIKTTHYCSGDITFNLYHEVSSANVVLSYFKWSPL